MIQGVPTPALVLDLAALDRNIGRMAAFFAGGPCRLRPHFKAHKTPEIARRQLEAGSCSGLTCATVGEAEVAAGITSDILVANELVTADKCERAASLARGVSVTVAADSSQGLAVLSRAARRAGTVVGVLVDVNVGQGRCGVPPGDAAVALAREAVTLPGLRLRGVMGYEGHLQPVRDRNEREAKTRDAMSALVATAGQVRAAGLPCEIVSAGGTGTYDISGRVPGITEIQAGSYALMDTDYADMGLPFEHAFFVLGTVVSRAPGRCVADCGHKAVTKDHGLPRVKDIEGAEVTALNDEHVVIALPPDVTVAIGQQVQLLPSHTDPTINLHDAFYVIESGRVIDRWAIAARGYFEQRAGAPTFG